MSLQPSRLGHHPVGQAGERLPLARLPLLYTHQNIAELWNAMTRPVDRNGLGLIVSEAEREVEAIEALGPLGWR